MLSEMRDDNHTAEDDLDRMEYEDVQGKDVILGRVMDQINPFWQVF